MIHYNQGPLLKLKGRRTMCRSPENHGLKPWKPWKNGLFSLIILSTCLNGFCLLFKIHWVNFSKSERCNIFILAIIFLFSARKGLSSQGYGFSSSHVWMWELDYKESWAQRIDAFELWCWRRPLRVPWTARRSNQSILKEISPGCSLEGLMLKLKLQYFGHLMQRTDSLEKTLMLGKIEGRRRRGR